MKKFIVLSIIISLGLAVYIFSISNTESSDKRSDYEAFILETAKDFNSKINSIDSDIKAADQPDMAAFQEYISTVDPQLGYVPDSRLKKAYEQTRNLMTAQQSNREYDPIMDWETSGSNMGGRTRAIMFDPNDADYSKVWAGGVTGGLWFINDITSATQQWQAVDDFWPNLAVSCICYDPNETETMYVGTGEAQTARIIYRKSSGLGSGIYKTTDAGETWELMPSTEDFAYVTDVVVKDENGVSVIYAGVVSGTYMGDDHESEPSDGLYRSANGGDTWTQVLPVIPGTFGQSVYAPSDIEIASNGRLFVGTMENLGQKGGATILYSDTGLEGSWLVYDFYNTKIAAEGYYNIPARTIIAVAPSNPDKVYAQFAAGYDNGFTYYRGRYMAKSEDGGETWSQILSPSTDEWATLAWHAFTLQVDPNNEDLIFTGGLDLWKSSNAGQNWRRVSDWALMYDNGGDAYVHADQHNIQFRPNHENEAIFSCDGGVFYSSSTNLTYPIFKERNNGYSTLQFYSAAISPTPGSDEYIGGLQDNGTLLHTGDALDIGDMIDGGDGAFCFWDRNDPQVYLTSVYYNRYTSWYANSQYDYIDGNSGTFISPADYDYKLDILYSNGVQFFGGYANRILRVTGVPFSMNDQLVNIGSSSSVPFSHIKYSRFSPNGSSTLFVGSQAGELYKVEDANSTPKITSIGSEDFPTANISCIEIGRSEDTLLVTFSNYGVSSVWQSYNGGESWQEKEANLPDMPIRWALYHPSNSGQALLATETGIWATNTLNESYTEWAPAVDGMANVRVDMLQLRYGDNMVLAATHGRGLFTGEYTYDLSTNISDNYDLVELDIYPNPASSYINIIIPLETTGKKNIKIFSVNGQLVLEKAISNNKITLDVNTYKSGSYYAVVSSESKILSRQWFIVN